MRLASEADAADQLRQALLQRHAPPSLLVEWPSLRVLALHGALDDFVDATRTAHETLPAALAPAWRDAALALLRQPPPVGGNAASEPLPHAGRPLRLCLQRLSASRLLLGFEPVVDPEAAASPARAQRRLGDAQTDVVWMTAPVSGRPIYLGPAFTALWGVAADEALAQPQRLLDALPPAAREALSARWQRPQPAPWSLTLDLLPGADGTPRSVQVDGRSVFDDEGREIYQVGTFVDLSAQRRREQALRESERQFRELAHSLPGLVWTCDLAGRCQFVSQQWLLHSGREAAELLGDGWLAALHPLDRLRVGEAWADAVRREEPFHAEFRLQAADGGFRWIDARAQPLRDAQGRVLRWFGFGTDIEDRKQAEQRVLRNAQLLQLVIDSVPSLLSYIDDRLVYRWVNRHYRDWFDVPSQQIVGHPVAEVVGTVIWQETEPLLRRALGGESIALNLRAKRPHWRRSRWIAVSYTPDHAEDGSVRGIVASVRDITEERRTTQALRDSEGRAKLIFETAPNAMLVVDDQGRIERVNRRAESLFGHAADSLLGQPVEMLMSTSQRGGHVALRDGWMQAPTAQVLGHRGELLAQRADGSEFPVEIGLGPMTVGGHTSVIVTLQDVSLQTEARRVLTEHRSRLEQEVNARTHEAQQAEAQMRLILESTADGLFGVDADGRIRFVNPAACALLGYSAAELMDQPALPLLLDGDDAGPAQPLQRTLATGVPARVERSAFRHRSGRMLPVLYAARAMWRDERIVGAVVSFQDTSERIAVEQARESALAEAERLARVRTEFLTNMSHEIRTPLNAVLGLAEVAARGDRERPPEETFRLILDSGQVLLGVVNDILDFSKIEAGKLRTESQPFELGPVIDRAVSLVAPRALAKGLAFRVDEQPPLPALLRGDALRLTQVLGNLLSNAFKFTESGAIELVVRSEGGVLSFAVRDTGIGISAPQLARLFKPFEQADSSTTRRFGGTGLGLVISRHLMALMGGSIGVSSEPGQGSTFTLWLPLQDAEPAPSLADAGLIVLAGLDAEAHVARALAALGFETRLAAPAEAFDDPAAQLVALPVDALRDEAVRDAAIAAHRRGQRIAVLTHPLAAELPEALRGEAVLLEQPLRARHLVAARIVPQDMAVEAEGSRGRLAGQNLLAAEDNEVNALVLEAIMRMEGARLTLVENGALAVEQQRRQGSGHYDLVLTDIQMPEMDGYTATRELRALDPTLPIVGLTAHAMPEERERCLAAGMVDHLAKPVEVEQLVAVVLQHSRRRPPPAPAER